MNPFHGPKPYFDHTISPRTTLRDSSRLNKRYTFSFLLPDFSSVLAIICIIEPISSIISTTRLPLPLSHTCHPRSLKPRHPRRMAPWRPVLQAWRAVKCRCTYEDYRGGVPPTTSIAPERPSENEYVDILSKKCGEILASHACSFRDQCGWYHRCRKHEEGERVSSHYIPSYVHNNTPEVPMQGIRTRSHVPHLTFVRGNSLTSSNVRKTARSQVSAWFS